MPSPCSAEMRSGSPRPNAYASRTPASAALPSALLAPRITWAARLRSISARTSSAGVTPTRASIRNRQMSAMSTARSVSLRIRPGRLSSVASSRPAVSMTVKRRSPKRAAPSRRSRVTPGWSSTSASRLPTNRLNRVDLPTLGRPTMARVKDMGAQDSGSDQAARLAYFPRLWKGSAIGVQNTVRRHDIKRAIRNNRAGCGTAANLGLADKITRCRIEGPQEPV